MADLEIPIIKHYQVPVVHFRDAVWPTISEPKQSLPCYWNGLSHPDAVAHELVASLVANGLAYSIFASEAIGNCPFHGPQSLSVPPFHQQLELRRFCSGIQGSLCMRADTPESFQALGSIGWKFREDVIGKPGWLYEGGNMSGSDIAIIWFRVHFSEAPRLEVTFLRTYENIGQVRMLIGPSNMTEKSLDQSFVSYMLDGFHESHISVPYMQTFVHPDNKSTTNNYIFLPERVGPGPFVVAFRADMASNHNKFKLISLCSC